jgi:flavin-binding protein dodecin
VATVLVGYPTAMSDQTYAITHVVGTSSEGLDQAIRNGIAAARKSVRNLDWFEVDEIRGHLSDGDVEHFQVTLKLGFRYED